MCNRVQREEDDQLSLSEVILKQESPGATWGVASPPRLRLHPSRWLVTLALSIITFTVYMGNARVISSADNLPARYLPIGILRHFSLYLDYFPDLYNVKDTKLYAPGENVPYYLQIRYGHYMSEYTPGPALLALPVYVVPVLAGTSANSPLLPDLEKLSASLIVTFSVLFLFWALREMVAPGWALVIAVVYAFGTSSLSVSSQGLWQHGPGQFFVALALFLIVKGRQNESYLGYAGFALGAAVLMRPTNALVAVPIGLWIIHKHRKDLFRFAAFAVPPLAFMFIYNLVYFSSIVGHVPGTWDRPLLEGLSGLLFSPARGLFIYSPIILLSLVGIYQGWRSGDCFLRYLSLCPLFVVLLYSKWWMWWGGHTYGPRLLSDLFPILCFFLYPAVETIRSHRAVMAAFVFLALMSIGVHTLGAYDDDFSWNSSPNIDMNQYRLWTWYDSPIVHNSRTAFDATRAQGHRLFRGIKQIARHGVT